MGVEGLGFRGSWGLDLRLRVQGSGLRAGVGFRAFGPKVSHLFWGSHVCGLFAYFVKNAGIYGLQDTAWGSGFCKGSIRLPLTTGLRRRV